MKAKLLVLVAMVSAAVAGVSVQAKRLNLAGEHSPASMATSAVTAQQRAMLSEKLALIDRILRTTGAAQPGSPISPEQLRYMKEGLYGLPLAQLRSMGIPGSAEATIAAIARESVAAAKRDLAKLGQLDDELVYIPMPPCRFIDTRVLGGPIVNTRSYDLDSTGFAYGGSATCNPKSLVGNDANNMGGIVLNVTIYNPSTAPGFMGVRPQGSMNTTSLVNWYEVGPDVQAANSTIVTIDQSLAADEIEFFGTSTHLIVDIMGLFAAPTSTPLDCQTGTLATANLNTTTRDYNLVAGTCPAGFGMVSNSCQALGDIASLRQAGGGVVSAGSSTCFGRYEGSSSVTVTNTPWCCRLPGR